MLIETASDVFLDPAVDYTTRIRRNLNNCLTHTDLAEGRKMTGKVRDRYDLGNVLALITTDRQSAFDRLLAAIPFKGQVLNQTSAWWFEQSGAIAPNHLIAVPDPNVSVVKKCTVFPIEFVVRGYITGTTSTSLWTVYDCGAREYCGHRLEEGLKKNERLPAPLLTPTTKEAGHDRPISAQEIISEGWMTEGDWEAASAIAMRLFACGQDLAREQGLILVDTKYELGRDREGDILVVDEIHTPDSSRYWIQDSYQSRFSGGQEPENIDKEFLRLWFVEHCDPYRDENLPLAPEELVIELSRRYILLYEMITGKAFSFPDSRQPVPERIRQNLAEYL